MSRPATLTTTGIRGALNRASNLVRETTVRQAWYDLAWQWLASLAFLVFLDFALDLPVWIRWVGLLGLASYAIGGSIRIQRRISKREFSAEHSARLVEEAQPGMDSVLINAVQFQRVVETAPESQAELMRYEISRAETAVARTPFERVISRDGERRALKILLWALGIWALGALLFSGMLFTILPRLFAPWMDDVTPPFSATRIDLNPKGASVKYGGSLVVTATIQGPIPGDLKLATKTIKGTWSYLPLEVTEPGKHSITLNALREDTWMVVRGGGARSGRYLVKIVLPPVASSLKAQYRYPTYTGFKDATEVVDEKGVHGLRDTKVTLQVTANRALTGGELVLEPDGGRVQHVALKVDAKDPSKAEGTFPITAGGKFHLELTSTDAQVNPDAGRGKIVLEHDQRPSVWFDQPAPEIAVTPDMKVGLEIEASDDIGVQRIDLHRVINGIADNNQTLFDGPPEKQTGANLMLDMSDLGVRPGDELTYYANAYDNDPGRPNFAQTEAYKIKVLSKEDYEKMLQEQRDTEQLTREIKDIKDAIGSLAERQQALAEKMEKLEKDLKKDPSNAKTKEEMTAALQEQKKLQADAKMVADHLQQYAKSPSASPLEKALKEKIGEAAKSIADAANGPMQAAQNKPGSPSGDAKKAAETLKKASDKAEKQVGEAIKNIEKVEPLYNDVERFKTLLDRQGQLVLQSREFEDKTPSDEASRSKMEAITAEQQRMQEALKQLQEDFRRHAADAKKDFPKAAATAIKIADEIGGRKIPDLMGSAGDAFSQERGPVGFSNAQKALDQMVAMSPQAGACQSNCKGELDLSLMRSLGSSGLGQSMGSGAGSARGAGSAGSPSNNPGTASGTAASSNPVAYTMSMKNLTKEAGTKKANAQNVNAGSPASLSPDRVEVLANGKRHPPKATDDASSKYPAEYRKLVKDYFISVTKEKKH